MSSPRAAWSGVHDCLTVVLLLLIASFVVKLSVVEDVPISHVPVRSIAREDLQFLEVLLRTMVVHGNDVPHKATSHLLLEPDLAATIQLCDHIRQGDTQPKYALSALKKKLYDKNPNVQLFSLQVLESWMKNCGTLIHDEVATRPFMEELQELVQSSGNEKVRSKILELVQVWAYAFRNEPRYRVVQDTVNIMKADGNTFPALKESDAMFAADTAPKWVDGDCCHRCRTLFSVIKRKHHCRACGQIFCDSCSSHHTTLPKFGIEKEVRVCDTCWEKYGRSIYSSLKSSIDKEKEDDLPAEYLASSLSKQPQLPATKTEEELREEEELQLALALSQSEAESKDHKQKQMKGVYNSRPAAYSPSFQENNAPEKVDGPESDPELARYLNRSYWEKKNLEHEKDKGSVPNDVPSAPVSNVITTSASVLSPIKNNETLFLNITSLHSRLIQAMEEEERKRCYYEGLQDKLSQIRDARAALDALREEHRDRKRREAEEAQRLRQIQMAQKLEIMRKKKQEYLEYQRQMAMQRMQEQEREMQMRHEQEREMQMRHEQQMHGYQMGQPQMPVSYPMPHVPTTYPVPSAGYMGGVVVNQPTGVPQQPPVLGAMGPQQPTVLGTMGQPQPPVLGGVGPQQPSGIVPSQQPGMIGPHSRPPPQQQQQPHGVPSQPMPHGSPLRHPQQQAMFQPGISTQPPHPSAYQFPGMFPASNASQYPSMQQQSVPSMPMISGLPSSHNSIALHENRVEEQVGELISFD
ncbi:unnamed protein product [Darwinula stevensoni]|uniref:Hepatocyte growth factor-regulated tyrosine kinase substrate n=1 Tax=Darwinula stevensoni TaxID=69355 RepID=A0A7R9A4M1_9CRUS|nr:unnamed protein product [Darwinula stevensoni]CAG0890299.1 unnamed protein product [Darwinula stevensoni]